MNEHSYFNRILLLKTIFLFEVFLGVTNHSCFAFTIATKLVSPTARTNAAITFSPSILTLAQAAKNDDDNDIPPPPSNKRPSLGIDIGAQLTPLTPEQAAELKSEASEKINEAFDGRLDEIENMRTQIAQDFETSKQKLRKDSDERAQVATTKLMSKIDQLSNDFLMENEELRMGTKLSAKADRNNMNEGNGLEVGSWGSVGGMNVGMSMGLKGGSSGLLGSVASVASGLSSVVEEEEDDTSDSRIMVICDDKQDKNVQKVLDRFETLLENQFTNPVTVEYLKPTATIPMGGNDAKCVIISSTSLSNGQSSANNILSRLLRRTISPGGGKVAKPPSHYIIISPLGTERIEKYPYSMTNMMGGNKLKKAREVEEVVISTVKGRLVADSATPPLDYTILKLGDIVNDEKVGSMEIAPGDSLDGKVGIEAAANTLLQSVVLRPLARNTTLSVVGGCSVGVNDEADISEDTWEDWFLRLDGPELWRKEGLFYGGGNVVDVDRRFEELAGYIDEWSCMFKDGAKGTGLTTPVDVVQSRFTNEYTSPVVSNRSGVRLEFRSTNTGNAYKSKSEEGEMEKQRSGGSASGPPQPSRKRSSKEGGVEIIVEKTTNKDGINDLRVRAKRCNMDDSTVVKELSEETILKKLEKALGVWIK